MKIASLTIVFFSLTSACKQQSTLSEPHDVTGAGSFVESRGYFTVTSSGSEFTVDPRGQITARTPLSTGGLTLLTRTSSRETPSIHGGTVTRSLGEFTEQVEPVSTGLEQR